MAAANADRRADGFAVGNGRVGGVDGDAVFAREPLQRDAEVHFPLPFEQRLAGLLADDDAKRRVFLGNLGERGGELHVVPAAPTR